VASLVKKEGSRYWFVAYRDAQGKQHRKSTQTTDRKKALRIAETYESLAQRKVKPHRVRETIAAICREVYGEDVPSATVREFIDEWLKTKEPEIARSTFLNYSNSASKFLHYLGPAADGDISTVRKASIAGFRNHLQLTVSTTTTNLDLKVIKSVFRSAKADGYLLDNPAEFVETVRRSKGVVRRAFTIDELRSIIEAADDETASLVRFGLYTGQRLGDVAALTWSNVDLERGIIRFATQKTSRIAVIPIAEPLRAHILSLPVSDDPRAPLHPKSFGKPTNELSNRFIDLLAAIGLRRPVLRKRTGRGPKGRRTCSEVSFHSLRHTAVTLLKDAGVPQAVVQELIGHDSARVSAAYTHVGLQSLQKAAATLPAL